MYTHWHTQLQLIQVLQELPVARRTQRGLFRRLTTVVLAVLGMR